MRRVCRLAQGPVGEYNLKTGLPIDPTGWLFKGWVDGHPALGWEATAAYLSLPIILVWVFLGPSRRPL